MTAACGVLAAACGSVAAPTSAGSAIPATSGHPASTTSAAKASLEITMSGGNSATKEWTLRCDPPGGTRPDPAAACTQLLKDKTIFTQQRVKEMCPMILAYANSFTISGTWFGHHVHETVVDGGCDLARWSVLHQVFN